MSEPEKWDYHEAIVEWESCGLEDIPTANLKEFKEDLEEELQKRLGDDF